MTRQNGFSNIKDVLLYTLYFLFLLQLRKHNWCFTLRIVEDHRKIQLLGHNLSNSFIPSKIHYERIKFDFKKASKLCLFIRLNLSAKFFFTRTLVYWKTFCLTLSILAKKEISVFEWKVCKGCEIFIIRILPSFCNTYSWLKQKWFLSNNLGLTASLTRHQARSCSQEKNTTFLGVK